MKFRFTKSALLLSAIIIFSAFSAFAQETQSVVVDEVIAQVNDGVITLSRVKREMDTAAESLVQKGAKPDVAKAEIEKKKGELIANLVNEELLMQKGKELGVENDVEAQINKEFSRIMKEQNIKTIADLYAEMKKAGVDPEDLRDTWRRQFTQQMVLQNDVDRKVYFSWSNKEIKDYYEQHKDKFTTPESVTLSEIFLSYAGRNPDEVKKKADQLIASMRAGADFTKTAVENSDDPNVATNKGVVGNFKLPELNEKVVNAIKGVKVGDFGKLENDEGIEIIRVDARTEASKDSVFDENDVRSAMTYEKLPEERKKYISSLVKDAYIKISDSYKPIVSPFLYNEDNKTASTNTGK